MVMTATAVLEPVHAAAPAAGAAAPPRTAAADVMTAIWRLHGGALLRFALKLSLGAVAGLAPGHREVIVGMYYHGQHVDEIARSLGIPAGTVKSRAYYALRQLRGVLSAPYADAAGVLAPPGRGAPAAPRVAALAG